MKIDYFGKKKKKKIYALKHLDRNFQLTSVHFGLMINQNNVFFVHDHYCVLFSMAFLIFLLFCDQQIWFWLLISSSIHTVIVIQIDECYELAIIISDTFCFTSGKK